MIHLIRTLTLGTAISSLTLIPLATNAQEKKAPIKKGGEIQVREGADGKFRFQVRNADDKYLAGSLTGYEDKNDALKAAAEFKAIVGESKVVFSKVTAKDKDDDAKDTKAAKDLKTAKDLKDAKSKTPAPKN
jgi:hypothetical protein